MMMRIWTPVLFSFLLILSACEQAPETDTGFNVEVDYYKLENGLRVVLAPEPSAPTVTVAVYYNIGFRNEPQGLTGFAHLFEHMMFEATPNMPSGAFDQLVEGGGGVNNGSTRYDYTNYFEIMPSHQLEPILWVEADRMTALDLSEENLENQKGVVTNEVRVNVLNQPYGGFPWLDMPQAANENWYNAHNFYGDLDDLQAATLADAQSFFDTYYSPNNAVLVVAGDFDTAQAREWVAKYFNPVPAGDLPPPPDLSEPEQVAEKFVTIEDAFAPKPALAFSYHMPDRGSEAYYAMGFLDLILLQGEDSRLYQKLVKDNAYTDSVFGGINMIGNMFNYNGPMLFTAGLIHDPEYSSEVIMAAVDEVIADVQANGVSEEEMDRAMRKLQSGLYDTVGSATRFGLVDLLAAFALFDDNPARINSLEAEFQNITPAIIQQAANDYLRPSNRTVLERVPASEETGEGEGQ